MAARKSTRLLILAGLLLPLLLLGSCLSPRPFDEAAWRGQAETASPADLHAPHRHPDGTFFNPWLPQNRSFGEILYWYLSRNTLEERQREAPPAPAVANDGAYLADPAQPDSLTWIGHATYALQWSGQVVLTDPFFGERALVVKRLVPPAFAPEMVPPGAVVVISHNHYDHLDEGSVKALGGRATFLVPLGLGDLVRRMGAQRVIELDWWQEAEVEGTRFTCLPAQHWSRRLGQGYNESLWCAWMMERGGRKVFYGGDSGYFIGFREIGRRWPGIDLALLGAGAYHPRWFMHYAHMDVEELLRAHRELGARRLVPTQWGVLRLGHEAASWPATELRERAEREPGLARELLIMPVGGRVALDQ
jgi:L-ascorbate metabolism protein UlaG (beta-lactamase superfamily)